MFLKHLILCLLVPTFTYAQTVAPPKTKSESESVPTSPTPPPQPPSELTEAPRPIETQFNYFGFSLALTNALQSGTGGGFYYGRRLNEQFVVGTTIGSYESKAQEAGTGNSAIGQYYRGNSSLSAAYLEVNATYFFREHGFRRFGFLARTGVGLESGKVAGNYSRYDDDPAFFQFGDGKRLIETGPNQESTYSRMYFRIEPAYQFLWAPRRGFRIGGHTLEIATSFAVTPTSASTSYTRPDGKTIAVEVPKVISSLKISYILVF